MLSIEVERAHLAKAERDIIEGEARITRQAELVAQMRSKGQGVREAEALLATLQETLQGWRDHREEILRVIAGLESGAYEPGGARPSGS